MKELPKTYEPLRYEDGIYKKWEKSGCFKPENLKVDEDASSYAVSMPPPNVTGVLHLGHALENAIMDIAVRYQRMRGKRVLLIPGTDHAAVATQAKVEKELMKQGIARPREELGREKLLEKIREYAENSKATIIKQIKKMGTSCDWDRLAYTFDEKRSRAVNEIFKRMYDDGLIYRGNRVVNWSVKGQSTCSDDELVYREEKTKLYTFKYGKVMGGESDGEFFPIAISTTRPETKLGDTAVAVHPEDKRYKKYIGRTYAVDVGAAAPLKIKIVADKEVDPDFGTGAVGVTPAHSQIDFEMAQRHGLKSVRVIGTDGRMTAEAGRYKRLDIAEARERFIARLRSEGLIEKEEEIVHNVGTSDRFGDIVEVLPMEQWFVGVNRKIPGCGKTLKDLMREAVTAGHNGAAAKKININPKRFHAQYLHWIDNLRDWCISRQIWWGHRIPVWYRKNQKSNDNDKDIYVGIEPPDGENWTQDPDTLDTWFSSGTWTFSILGWPEKTDDLKKFHPNAWMQMGYEILFFWMARMILMSTYALDDIPFREVYIHGVLRDKEGRKFSKSLGTGIDPIKVAAEYGTDALRLSLILGVTPGNDSRFYEEKAEGARNLVNKLWNISRYIITNYELRITNYELNKNDLTLADRWILGKLDALIAEVTRDLDNYNFSQAGEKLREFTWDYLADWYLEAAKFEQAEEKAHTLKYTLKCILKLWHPFIPFVTEVIWEKMGNTDLNNDLLMTERWPALEKNSASGEEAGPLADFELVKDIITAIRNARAEHKVAPGRKIKAVIYAGDNAELVRSQEILIKNLRTGISELEVGSGGEKPENAIYAAAGGIEIYLLGAVDEQKEKERLAKEIANLEKLIASAEKKLANKEFIAKAPAAIVQKEKDKLAARREELGKLKERCT